MLARLELTEATGVLDIDVGWVNGKLPADLVPQRVSRGSRPGTQDGGPCGHLALVCFLLTERGATCSTEPSPCTASCSTPTASWSKNRLAHMLKAERHTRRLVRSPLRHARSGAARSRRWRRGPVRPGQPDAGLLLDFCPSPPSPTEHTRSPGTYECPIVKNSTSGTRIRVLKSSIGRCSGTCCREVIFRPTAGFPLEQQDTTAPALVSLVPRLRPRTSLRTCA